MATALEPGYERRIANHQLVIGGLWVQGGDPLDVTSKYSNRTIASVSQSRPEDIEAAIVAARHAAPIMAALPAYRCAEILQTIAAEAGKPLKYARIEVERGISTFTSAAKEAKRIHGVETLLTRTIALDAINPACDALARGEAVRQVVRFS